MRPRAGLAALILIGLAACDVAPDAATGGAGRKGLLSSAVGKAPPLQRVTLAGGDVQVVPPEGYCIDAKSRRGSAERGFAAIAACRVLTDGKAGPYVEPVLMTVTTGPRGDAGDLPSPEALSEAAQAPLIAGSRTDNAVFAHLARGGAAALPGGDRRHWRAAFVANGRLVGLALYAPEGNPMAAEQGADLLLRLKTRIQTDSETPRKKTALRLAKPAKATVPGGAKPRKGAAPGTAKAAQAAASGAAKPTQAARGGSDGSGRGGGLAGGAGRKR